MSNFNTTPKLLTSPPLFKNLGNSPNYAIGINTKGQSPLIKILRFINSQFSCFYPSHDIILLNPTFLPLFTLFESLRIFIFNVDALKLQTPLRISLTNFKNKEDMLWCNLVLDHDRVELIREVVCPDRDVILPGDKNPIMLRLSSNTVPDSVLKQLNSFNRQMFDRTQQYAFSGNFMLRDLLFVSLAPKQALLLTVLSPFGIFSNTNSNSALTSLLRRPELLRAINELLEESVLENIPRPGMEEEDVVVEEEAESATVNLREEASVMVENKEDVATAQRQEVKSALARGQLEASMLLRKTPQPQRPPRERTGFAEAARDLTSVSTSSPSAPGLCSSTPAGTSAPGMQELTVSAVVEALQTPSSKGIIKKRMLKQEMDKQELSNVEIANLANLIAKRPDAVDFLMNLAAEEKMVIQQNKDKGITNKLSEPDDDEEEEIGFGMEETDNFHTPKAETTSKSVTFPEATEGAAALVSSTLQGNTEEGSTRRMNDHQVTLYGRKTGKFLYSYRVPVPGYPVPQLRYTDWDSMGKRKYYYEDVTTKSPIFWENQEVIWALTNHHLELPAQLDVDEEVKLKSGVVTVRDIIENGFAIMKREQKAKEINPREWFGWRDKKENKLEDDSDNDNEVQKLTEKPPPYEEENDNIYEKLPEEQSNASTYLLGDNDATMQEVPGADDTTKLPSQLLNPSILANTMNKTDDRTASGVRSPINNLPATPSRGRGRGGVRSPQV